jgi:Domain of unknown function (DUF4838)
MKKILIHGIFLCTFFNLVIITNQVFAGEHLTEKSKNAVIASDGKALLPIIISPKATPEVRKSAEDLARYLGRMSGGKFAIKTGDGKTGIAVGTIKNFPEIPFKPHFDAMHPGERQGYEIKSHAKGIYIIGATPQAVDYAIYDLLRRLGYRHYFPMKKWEIIPLKNQLELSAHIREIPDYYTRRIWPGYGYWRVFRASAAQWNRANSAKGYHMNTGHAYDRIIRRNKAAFKAHPEYYGLLKGERKSSKFCISNPGLRKLVSDYAINAFQTKKTTDSISMDPSDGGNWCECAACVKLGTPSDRALFLANTVAEAVNKKYSEKRVGMYAYNQHSPPPSINVHPNVVINIATGFIRGGYSLDELISGWSKKKATIGIREYYDVYIWTYNAPGKAKGGNLNYLKNSITDFYRKGARYMTSEAGDNWGPNGLGYYLAQRMLWNIQNSRKIDALTKDFIQNCFGPAAGTMKKFYNLLDGSNQQALCANLLGRMYRLLAQARKEASEKPAIISRLDDLVIYTRYCELLMVYLQNTRKPEVLENLLRFTARSKDSRMVHSHAAFRRLNKKLPKKTKPIDWKKSKPFTPEEINKFVTNGIAANKLLDFTPVGFDNELLPVMTFMKQSVSGKRTARRRGVVTYYTWADKNPQPIKLSVTGGMIKHYRDRGNVKIKLYKLGGASDTGTKESLIQTDASVPPDGKLRSVTLVPKQSGLHKIVISDGNDMTLVGWEKGTPITFRSDGTRQPKISGSFYFYVPKGTTKLGFYCNMGRGYIVSPDGKRMFKFKRTSGFRSLGIPAGMDGKVWKLQRISGQIGLMTVPPFLAVEPAGLLLPEDVVKKDNL